jgi:hypothetical protein
MEIAVESKEWGRLIDGLSLSSYCKLLRELAGRMNISKYKKVRRGVKKPVVRKDGGSTHISTAKILAERDAKKQGRRKQ